MNQNEFVQKITAAVKAHAVKAVDLMEQEKSIKEEQGKLNSKLGAFNHSQNGINEFNAMRKPLNEKVYNIHAALIAEQRAAQAEANTIYNDYMQELADGEVVNASDLTDDINILNDVIPLEKKDIDALMLRYSGNFTMLRAISGYAKKHDIQPAMQYIGNDEARAKAAEKKEVVDLAISRIASLPALTIKLLG